MTLDESESPAWRRISLTELKSQCVDSLQAQRRAAHIAVDAHFDNLMRANLQRLAELNLDDRVVEH